MISFDSSSSSDDCDSLFNQVVDLFKEGSGVVVLGYLNDKTIFAEEVLAKHDENYMPPSIDIQK